MPVPTYYGGLGPWITSRTNPRTTTGNPGSVIVPKSSSSKTTVLVRGENTILKFVGNTVQKSMKLCDLRFAQVKNQ